MEKNIKNIQEFLANKLVRILANHSVNFFKKSFINQGFTDKELQKWKPSFKAGKKTASTILVRTGKLKRSIRILNISPYSYTILAGNQKIPYAAIHNNGGTITITTKMRKYFWYMYSATGNDMWKFLAITKKKNITIPQRQFIGESKTLNKELLNIIENEFNKLFK